MLRYAITDGSARVGPHQQWAPGIVERCAELAFSGVDYLLVREKELKAQDLARLSRSVLAAVRGSGKTQVLILGRVDVAVAVGADGVHLASGAHQLTVEQVRRVFHGAGRGDPYVSVSCHALDEVQRARGEGASAILFAPVFGKWIAGARVTAGVGLKELQKACEAAGEVPVFALGAVTPANAPECVAAGAAGVAGIRMFFG